MGLLLGLASSAAQAANVLLLMTNEDYANAAITEFSGATVKKILDVSGAVTEATFKDAPGPYDLVVVISVYNPIALDNLAVLQNAINQRWANAFTLFFDGCCNTTVTANHNVDKLVSLLQGTTGQGITVGNYADGQLAFPLNTALPAASDFTSLNPLYGGWVNYLNNVPFNNTLYLPAGTTVPNPAPAGDQLTTAFGALFPQTQINGGQGACLFAVVDATVFDPVNGYASNSGKLATAFETAAAVGSTACRIAAPPGQTAGAVVGVPTLRDGALWGLALLLSLTALAHRRRRV